MLIDATHPEETRVAVVDGTRLDEFDFEIASRRQIKSNIYLAKITRVEPSLQAAFVEYGGNRHGFLPFPEIHPDYYRIPVGDRQVFDDDDDEPHGRAEPPVLENHPEADHSDEARPLAAETLAEAAAADPVISEAVFEAGDAEPASVAAPSAEEAPVIFEGPFEAPGAFEPFAGEPAQGETAEGETAYAAEAAAEGESDAAPASEQRAAVEIVGGDEVEEQQRRRRSQMPRYKIQEVIKRRQIMLVQVSKEERGNKGAAVTTFLSLPGRYCVLMPNTARGGGVSRKIANPADRKRMKDLISDLEVPEGMSVILRTAGVERSKAEIKRDLEYLLRLWENIRTLTLESTAPALIYEEGNLVKRAIRDLYSRDIGMIEIAGDEGYRQAKDFMRMLMPSHAKRVQPYRDPSIPLFFRYQVESQIDAIHNPVAHLKSGGYIVINQTEALVSIDVNSGRSTRERNIEETALKTNLEAADEIARQLRLRDLGGLIVIDFIDMDEPRHDGQVERRLKEAMKNDRARIQVGRISPFGLLELSRQRLHPSLIETNFQTCPHCIGTGLVRSIESAALLVLRAIEEEGIKHRAAELSVTVAGRIALYILNQKRSMLADIERRYGFSVRVLADDSLIPPEHRIERVRMKPPGAELPQPANLTGVMEADAIEIDEDEEAEEPLAAQAEGGRAEEEEGGDRKRKRGRRRRRRGRDGRHEELRAEPQAGVDAEAGEAGFAGEEVGADEAEEEAQPGEPDAERGEGEGEGAGRRRRRGRRGGRGRSRRGEEGAELPSQGDEAGDEIGGALPLAAYADEGTLTETEAIAAVVPSPASIPEPVTAEAEDVLDLVAPTEPEPVEHAPAGIEPARIEPSGPAPDEAQPEATQAVNGGAEEPAHEPAPSVPPTRDYETVNRPPEQPRRGWWKRLVE